MSYLPKAITSLETLNAKNEAKQFTENLVNRNIELQAIYNAIQPLLYELSVKLYGEKDDTIELAKLIQDSIELIKETK